VRLWGGLQPTDLSHLIKKKDERLENGRGGVGRGMRSVVFAFLLGWPNFVAVSPAWHPHSM
jgi:hypothetical protein